jgi:hypothetical protein
MTVYVDDVKHRFGRMIMCHMWADTDDELMAMADRIGVARKWIQGHQTLSLPQYRKASWVHFDIAQSKKLLAIQHGAVLTDKYGPSEFLAKRDLTSGDLDLSMSAADRLARIERSRELP